MSRAQQPRTQKPSVDEKYEAYLLSMGEPENALANPLNLFDGLNAEDKAWFRLAKLYMTRKARNLYDSVTRTAKLPQHF